MLQTSPLVSLLYTFTVPVKKYFWCDPAFDEGSDLVWFHVCHKRVSPYQLVWNCKQDNKTYCFQKHWHSYRVCALHAYSTWLCHGDVFLLRKSHVNPTILWPTFPPIHRDLRSESKDFKLLLPHTSPLLSESQLRWKDMIPIRYKVGSVTSHK